MIAYAASALTFPLNAFIMHRYVGEFSINSTTITGIVVTVASQLVAILGWYIILEGNTRGGI
jgi:hypothetical protein